MFADDIKLFTRINSNLSSIELQRDLNEIEAWCKKNCIEINITKCKYMKFSRLKKDRFRNMEYVIAGEKIVNVDRHKDLGVVMDSELTFAPHYDYIISKANMRLGYVMRNANGFADPRVHVVLYCALVRSIMEYGSTIWNPQYRFYIDRLERIQIKFIKYMCYKWGVEYHSVLFGYFLQYLGLLKLTDRRKILDAVFGCGVLSSHINCPELLGTMGLHAPLKRCRTSVLLYIPICSTNYATNAVMNRVKKVMNEYAGKIDFFSSDARIVKRKLSDLISSLY